MTASDQQHAHRPDPHLLQQLADALDGLEPGDFDGLTSILSAIVKDNKQVLFGGNGHSEWSVLGSYYHQFTPKFGGSVGFQYFSDFYVGGTDVSTGFDGYSAELSLVWLPVTDFEVRTEVQYDKVDTFDGTVSGYLRFQRNF